MIKKLYNQYLTISAGRFGSLVDVAIFSLIIIIFHYLWWNILGFFRATDFFNAVAGWLAQQVYFGSLWFNVNILGMNITPEHLTNTLWFPDVNGYITVNESCSGFKQMYQILFLFILFRGPWKHKLWYIPASMGIMFLVNILRIILLSLVLLHWPAHWDFFHLWVMRPFYYVVIFIEWVVWVEYFANKRTVKSALRQELRDPK
jgi:exosortase/archaeosortase family protein